MTHAEFQSAAESLVAKNVTVTTTISCSRYSQGKRVLEFAVYAHVGGNCIRAEGESADEALAAMQSKLVSPADKQQQSTARLSLVGDVAAEMVGVGS